jgi:ABC-type transporter Mla subunit MlaD
VFDGCWLEPREFTVNVKPHERRAAKQQSHYYLRSLHDVAKDINDTLVELKDLTNAFNQLKFNPDEYDLLLPLVKQVVDAACQLKEDNDVEYSHRLHQFQVIVRQVASKLHEPEILTNL